MDPNLLEPFTGYIYPNEYFLQWELLIVLYPYITGLVAGAFILASLERVFQVKVLWPVYRAALPSALAFMIGSTAPTRPPGLVTVSDQLEPICGLRKRRDTSAPESSYDSSCTTSPSEVIAVRPSCTLSSADCTVGPDGSIRQWAVSEWAMNHVPPADQPPRSR